MLKSSLCDYSDAYIPVPGTITITRAGAYAVARQADKRNKQNVKLCYIYLLHYRNKQYSSE